MKDAKISIVTINKNNCYGLEKTIKSIIKQKKIYELIVIDGKSTDNSFSIIKKYQSKINKFIFEKDKNISDAFNKGIKLSKSKWILFLNSGDYFYNKKVLELIEKDILFYEKKDLLIYKLIFKSKIKKKEFGGRLTDLGKMKHYNTIPHQSLIMKRNLFKRFGLYSTKYPIAQDYEFLLRIIDKIKIAQFDNIVSIMTDGGVTENNQIKCLYAFFKAKQKNRVNNFLINTLDLIFGIIKLIIKKILK